MTMVKTLVALATERMLLKTSGPTFLRGIEFMYAAGLAPDRLSVMMTSSHKFVLQFHSKCDIRPFAANYPNFGRVLRGIVHVREWRIKSIEFVNVAFYMRDVDNLERAIEKLGVELVLLRNCTYPGVQRGEEAVKFLSALNRKKQAVVCEYGDDRLKHRIGRRSSGHRTRRTSRNGQDVVAGPGEPGVAGQGANVEPDANGPEAGNNEDPVQALNAAPPGVRRPIPLNPEQARQLIPQLLNPGAAAQARDAPIAEGQRNGQQNGNGRVVVGAHVYEFRAVDVPVPGEILPVAHNVNNFQLNHLLNVLSDNANNDVRVIVLPSRGGEPGAPINLNNNDVIFRHISRHVQQPPVAPQQVVNAFDDAVRQRDHERFARVQQLAHERAQEHFARVQQLRRQRHDQFYDQQPPNLMVAPSLAQIRIDRERAQQPVQQPELPIVPQPLQQAMWNNFNVANAPPDVAPRADVGPAQVPMFGVAVNEPQVHRNGDDSNDSTDREEVYDPEQRRQEVLRDLVADPEAQPNFAPVEAQAVDLDMLEEEGEDDEVMEGVVVDGQFMMDDQAVME